MARVEEGSSSDTKKWVTTSCKVLQPMMIDEDRSVEKIPPETNNCWWRCAHPVGKPADSWTDLGESALSGGPRHLAWWQEDSAAGWGSPVEPKLFHCAHFRALHHRHHPGPGSDRAVQCPRGTLQTGCLPATQEDGWVCGEPTSPNVWRTSYRADRWAGQVSWLEQERALQAKLL